MKQVLGIWLPDQDTHFAPQLGASPLVAGKATYQLKKYRAALKYVDCCRHAVDVGGHVGLWSRVMSMDFDRVTAYEPLAAHRECFKLNAPDADLFPYAVGSRPGSVHVHMPVDNTGHAHVLGSGEEARMVRLDDMDLAPVDLLKIDVEGFEYDVLLGAEELVRQDQPVVVVEQKRGNAERYGRRQWDAVELLKSWGMREEQVISGDHIMVFG